MVIDRGSEIARSRGEDMIIKINLRSIVLMLALVLILMSTNAVAIAQEGTDPEVLTTPTVEQYTREDYFQANGINPEENREALVIPGGPGFISIHPSQFLPIKSNTEYGFYGIKEIHGPVFDPSHALVEFLAPVDLPHQATINQLVITFVDLNIADAFNVSISLNHCDFSYSSCSPMASITAVGSGAGYNYTTTSTFSDAKVDRQLYSYMLHLSIPGGFGVDLTLVNLRLDYTYPTFMPTVQN